MSLTFLTGEPDIYDARNAAIERLSGRTNPTTPGSKQRRRPQHRRRFEPLPTTEQLGPPPTVYHGIMVVVALFITFGLVMVLSATSAKLTGKADISPYHFFNRQLLWGAIGAVLMLIAVRLPYRVWRPWVTTLAILAVGAMVLPFIPTFGVEINDARSWIRVGSFTVQPSEFVKIAAIAYLADHFDTYHDRLHEARYGIVPLTAVLVASAGISAGQGDLGSAAVIAATVLVLGVIMGVPVKHVGAIGAAGFAAVVMLIVTSRRRLARFTAFLDLEDSKFSTGYQVHQSQLSIANGGILGSGIGNGNGKLGHLPLAHSDFIFAVVADEFGLIGSIAVIGGFAVFVFLGVQAALAAPDRFGMVLAGGIALWFGFQAVVNIGGVTGAFPVTGLTLPFFSVGGSSLCASMIAAGLLLNVARRGRTAPAVTRPRRHRWRRSA